MALKMATTTCDLGPWTSRSNGFDCALYLCEQTVKSAIYLIVVHLSELALSCCSRSVSDRSGGKMPM